MESIICLILTCAFWLPGMFYAIWIVNNDEAEKRNRKLIDEMRKERS